MDKLKVSEFDEAGFYWKNEKIIGKGSFGVVTLWVSKQTGEKLAVKRPHLSSNCSNHVMKDRWLNEINILLKLNHASIVKCFSAPSCFSSLNDFFPILCMEYCTKGDLRRLLKVELGCGLSESALRCLVKDITEAMKYLHSLLIFHRDIKPENIISQDFDGKLIFKLIDLGFSKQIAKNNEESLFGDLYYIAPELFTSQKYTCTVDYWSLGLVIYESSIGFLPFLPFISTASWTEKLKEGSADLFFSKCNVCRSDFSSFYSYYRSRLSKPFHFELCTWLELLLKTNPKERGRMVYDDHIGDVVIFSDLNRILEKKVIHGFFVDKLLEFWFEIDENTTIYSIQCMIHNECGVKIEDQEVLLPRGSPPDPQNAVLQFWAPPEEGEWMFFVFSKQKYPHYLTPIHPVSENVLLIKQFKEFIMNKSDSIAAVCFIKIAKRATDLCMKLLSAQKVYLMHLMANCGALMKRKKDAFSSMQDLLAKANFFTAAYEIDVSNYTAQANNGGITSDKMAKQWDKMTEDVDKRMTSTSANIKQLNEGVSKIQTKISEIQKSPYARSLSVDSVKSHFKDVMNTFQKIYSHAEFEKLFDYSGLQAQVLELIKHNDKFLHDIFFHIDKLRQCLFEINMSMNIADLLSKEMEDILKDIDLYQKQRQNDIWNLLKTTVNHCKMVNKKIGGSSSTIESKKKLFTSLHYSNSESASLIKENDMLRSELEDWCEKLKKLSIQ